MATNPGDLPRPSQPAQPDVPPAELPPRNPDVDVPAPGADPIPTGPANPS